MTATDGYFTPVVFAPWKHLWWEIVFFSQEMSMMNDVSQVEMYIEKKDLAKLLKLPDELDDFSERSIVKCVDCIIKASDADIKKATKHIPAPKITESIPWQKSEENPPFDKRKCYALNLMLSQKFSSEFLQEAAQELTFNSVLELMDYLRFLLIWSPMQPEACHVIPSIEQLVDWLNAVIDSHFQQLNLAADAFPVIDSLHELVSSMAKSQVEAKSLQGTLYELIQQFDKQQKDAKNIGNYCIEVISF